MFKFNFNSQGEDTELQTDVKEPKRSWYASEEIQVPSNIITSIKSIPRNQILHLDYGDSFAYSCLSAKEVMYRMKEKSDNDEIIDVLEADKEHSDLLPGKYEGGLKTWECTKDLAVYFIKNEIKALKNELKEKIVLDLGCGSGMLGIMCLLHGADVIFQDYNKEVLKEMTIPNIFLNLDGSAQKRIELYSGDWASFLGLILEKGLKFDYILTSETIYNPENYSKIIEIFKETLKPDGIGFVAAKTHYFGVGGNLLEFEELLVQNGLISNVCWETNDATLRLLWLLRRVIKLERLIRLDDDIPDVSPFTTVKGIVSGQSQTFITLSNSQSRRLVAYGCGRESLQSINNKCFTHQVLLGRF